MRSTRKRRSGSRLRHDERDMPAFDTVSLLSNLGSPQRNYLSIIKTDINVLHFGSKASKGFWKCATGGSKTKKEKLISCSMTGNFWQPLISPEARKERSCQSFSASYLGPRADCPFHRPYSSLYSLPICLRLLLHSRVVVDSYPVAMEAGEKTEYEGW